MEIRRLKRQHLFEYLTSEQIHTLSEASEVIKLKMGEQIYREGDKAEYFYSVLKGAVLLQLPGINGCESVMIDELNEGALFGSCVSLTAENYFCTAECARDTELLKIRTDALKEILDSNCCVGYTVQKVISQIYFNRYLETMKNLQSVVKTISEM